MTLFRRFDFVTQLQLNLTVHLKLLIIRRLLTSIRIGTPGALVPTGEKRTMLTFSTVDDAQGVTFRLGGSAQAFG